MNQFSFQQELLRKFLHLSVLIFPILLLEYGKNNCLPYFFVISFLFLLMDIFRLRYKQIQLLYDRYFSIVTKNYERNNLTSASYVFLSILITVSLFDEGIASPALMIMILSDPIASVIGIIFGKFKLVGEKTLEGSITFFIITAIVLISFKFTSFQVILVALGATLIELFSKEVNIDDNLLIPLVSAGLLVIF